MLMPGRTPNIRQFNVGIVKQYAANYYKLTHLNSVRLAGFEPVGYEKATSVRGEVNSGKLANSLSRSRSRVFELALCNPWEFFCTLTIDQAKHDRYDLGATYKRLGKWFNNYNFRNGTSIRYLLIPEPHKDGAWHLHGLLMGIPLLHLTPFTLKDHIPRRIKDMLADGRTIYNWSAYADAFGFVTLEAIRNADACAVYMTKYITKELAQSSIELNHHVYYASQGLNRAVEICRGPMNREIVSPDFENEHVHIKHFNNPAEALSYIELEGIYGKDCFDC